MYSFIFDQTYINLFILVIIVSIVMFLWRKLIILEGNFFVLEKRVNLIKKDAREDSIAKNIEKSDIIMNEIFKDFTPSNACKQSACFSSTGGNASGTCDVNSCDPLSNSQKNNPYNITNDENMVEFISANSPKPLDILSGDTDIITFANSGNVSIANAGDDDDDKDVIEIDRMVDTIISSSEEYENKVHVQQSGVAADAAETVEYGEHNDNDNMSVSSEITFTSDDKKGEKTLMKKYSKMPLDKLKEVCNSININSDGTRNQLIARIIDVKK
jgi:hypothetical protein